MWLRAVGWRPIGCNLPHLHLSALCKNERKNCFVIMHLQKKAGYRNENNVCWHSKFYFTNSVQVEYIQQWALPHRTSDQNENTSGPHDVWIRMWTPPGHTTFGSDWEHLRTIQNELAHSHLESPAEDVLYVSRRKTIVLWFTDTTPVFLHAYVLHKISAISTLCTFYQ